MHEHIGIAVAIQAQSVGMLQGHTAENQGAASHQPVDVVAVADSNLHRGDLGRVGHCPAGVEIGAPLPGALLPLLLTPGLDRRMVAAAQHIRHRFTAEFRRAGVVGVLEQHGTVALIHQGFRRSHRARQQPHHPVDQGHRRELTPGEHEIADGHLLIGQAADAFIEALVVAAEQHQLIVLRGPALQVGLLQRPPLGRHQQHPGALLPGNRLHCRKHRLGLEHHAGTAAIGHIVHLAVAVGGEIARIVEMQLGDAAAEGATDDAEIRQGGEGLGSQAHHIEAVGRHGRSGRRLRDPTDVGAETPLQRRALGIDRRGAAQTQIGAGEPDPLLHGGSVRTVQIQLHAAVGPETPLTDRGAVDAQVTISGKGQGCGRTTGSRHLQLTGPRLGRRREPHGQLTPFTAVPVIVTTAGQLETAAQAHPLTGTEGQERRRVDGGEGLIAHRRILSADFTR